MCTCNKRQKLSAERIHKIPLFIYFLLSQLIGNEKTCIFV